MTVKRETESQSKQVVEPTAEEKELNRLYLERVRAAQPGTLALQEQGLNLGADLFSGIQTGQADSPVLNRLFAGISPEVTNDLVQQSIEDVRPGLQAAGLLNSGVRAELETETAAGIRRAVEESNLNNLYNLLNLSQGYQANIQQPLLNQSAQLSSALAGLRSVSSTGNSTYSYNPFLENFYGSAGSALGKGVVSGAFGGLQGGMSGFSSAGVSGASGVPVA